MKPWQPALLKKGANSYQVTEKISVGFSSQLSK